MAERAGWQVSLYPTRRAALVRVKNRSWRFFFEPTRRCNRLLELQPREFHLGHSDRESILVRNRCEGYAAKAKPSNGNDGKLLPCLESVIDSDADLVLEGVNNAASEARRYLFPSNTCMTLATSRSTYQSPISASTYGESWLVR